MGSASSSVRNTIESLAFPAPAASYDTRHRNFKYVDSKDTKSKRVACMFYTIKENITDDSMVILYSHGNGCDIGHMDNFLWNLARDMNLNIVSYDYEGYGLTEGRPSEEGCNRSIDTVYDHLKSLGYRSKNIILYGTSIGTGPTVNLASRLNASGTKLKGLLLQTPYTSIVGVVSEVAETSSYVSSSVVENPNIFRTGEKISQVSAPIIIVHGKRDEVIPYSHATKLQKNNPRSQLVTLSDATHNNIERDHYQTLCQCINNLKSDHNN